MPINLIKTKNGFHYYRYGKTGAKYYFNPKVISSQEQAYSKALRQSKAINSYRSINRNLGRVL